MPMPKPVCRTNLYKKIVQLEVCRTFSGRGMGINGTAQDGFLKSGITDDLASTHASAKRRRARAISCIGGMQELPRSRV